MPANVLDGREIANVLLADARERVARRVLEGRARPGLAVVLVGEDPASTVYVRNKRRACDSVGIVSQAYDLPACTPQDALVALIDRLNADPAVHGILVQLPLPGHIDAPFLIQRIHPHKDVDGFHAENVGKLALRLPGLRPCTSKAVMAMLDHAQPDLRGAQAVVVGVSNHVGRPMVLELLSAGCTVTACHRHTRDLPGIVAGADLLVVAVGKPGLIPGSWIRPGATVIDIGINRLPNGRLTGDVDYPSAFEKAGWLTPVPGGVGPVTVAMLMRNTVEAADAIFS